MEGGIDSSAGALHPLPVASSATTTEGTRGTNGAYTTNWVETLTLVLNQRTMYEGRDAWS